MQIKIKHFVEKIRETGGISPNTSVYISVDYKSLLRIAEQGFVQQEDLVVYTKMSDIYSSDIPVKIDPHYLFSDYRRGSWRGTFYTSDKIFLPRLLIKDYGGKPNRWISINEESLENLLIHYKIMDAKQREHRKELEANKEIRQKEKQEKERLDPRPLAPNLRYSSALYKLSPKEFEKYEKIYNNYYKKLFEWKGDAGKPKKYKEELVYNLGSIYKCYDKHKLICIEALRTKNLNAWQIQDICEWYPDALKILRDARERGVVK